MIYLLRHGEIKGASTKRYIGQTDVELSRKGIEQAKFWQKYFLKVSLDRVFTSPLSRTVRTSEIASELAGEEIIQVQELKEINLGEWDGKKIKEIKEQFPHQWEDRGKDLAGYRPPLGESFHDLSQRILPVFKQISNDNPGNILITAHAGVNRMILCSLLNKDLEDLFSIPQAYGCLNIIDNKQKKLRVQEMNIIPGETQSKMKTVPG